MCIEIKFFHTNSRGLRKSSNKEAVSSYISCSQKSCTDIHDEDQYNKARESLGLNCAYNSHTKTCTLIPRDVCGNDHAIIGSASHEADSNPGPASSNGYVCDMSEAPMCRETKVMPPHTNCSELIDDRDCEVTGKIPGKYCRLFGKNDCRQVSACSDLTILGKARCDGQKLVFSISVLAANIAIGKIKNAKTLHRVPEELHVPYYPTKIAKSLTKYLVLNAACLQRTIAEKFINATI